jgi:hypothetical protein
MNLNPVQYIRTRTRCQWQSYIREAWIESRAWIQENGEAAAGIGFFVGIVLVVLVKVMVFCIAIGVIAGFLFFYFAPESDAELAQWEEYYRGSLTVSKVVIPEEDSTSAENDDTVDVQTNGHAGSPEALEVVTDEVVVEDVKS